MHDTSMLRASEQDGSYPRPQLMRAAWADLSGPWEFAFDDADEGVQAGWATAGTPLDGTITVPFPPESPASGIGDTGFHRVLWYRRRVTAAEIATADHASGRRLLLHFGAVDYRADVWIDGHHAGQHEGGHMPFTVEVLEPRDGFEIVVRAEDDPHDLAQPRGKQDWEETPHAVWYHRTSGIWQTVWLESAPAQHIVRLNWRAEASHARIVLDVELASRPGPGARLTVDLHHADRRLARITVTLDDQRSQHVVAVPALRNGQAAEGLFWTPERPNLIDAVVTLDSPQQDPDVVASYLGIRTVGTAGGRFLLNDRPHTIRGVLSQGYWPQTHLAAPDAAALRAEAELIRELGFTTVRVHQKFEDPRFLYWADRLGLMVWSELPSVYEFSPTAAERLLSEWIEAIRRDISHPSIVVWVPFNESWGVQQLASDERQRDLVRSLAAAARALDGSRLVISNDGWEHLASDLFTIHDYENDAVRLLESYETPRAIADALAGMAPNGRRMLAGDDKESERTAAGPIILSEFGGVSVSAERGEWGYRMVEDAAQLDRHLAGLFAVVRDSTGLAGWCYTQLTDTAQETNGLVDERRVPKLPIERLRAMVRGEDLAPATTTPVP